MERGADDDGAAFRSPKWESSSVSNAQSEGELWAHRAHGRCPLHLAFRFLQDVHALRVLVLFADRRTDSSDLVETSIMPKLDENPENAQLT